jgi:hypothetical protein
MPQKTATINCRGLGSSALLPRLSSGTAVIDL